MQVASGGYGGRKHFCICSPVVFALVCILLLARSATSVSWEPDEFQNQPSIAAAGAGAARHLLDSTGSDGTEKTHTRVRELLRRRKHNRTDHAHKGPHQTAETIEGGAAVEAAQPGALHSAGNVTLVLPVNRSADLAQAAEQTEAERAYREALVASASRGATSTKNGTVMEAAGSKHEAEVSHASVPSRGKAGEGSAAEHADVVPIVKAWLAKPSGGGSLDIARTQLEQVQPGVAEEPVFTGMTAELALLRPYLEQLKRDTRIVLVESGCGDGTLPSLESEATCVQNILAQCGGAFGSDDCYEFAAVGVPECGMGASPPVDSEPVANALAALLWAVPGLRERGWAVEVVQAGQKNIDQALSQAGLIIAHASEVFASMGAFPALKDAYPDKKFIVLDTSPAATLDSRIDIADPPPPAPPAGAEEGAEVDDGYQGPQVVAVLKSSVLQPAELQNGEVDEETQTVHLARIPEFVEGPEPNEMMALPPAAATAPCPHPPFSPAELLKIVPLLPEVFRWAHPSGCGGDPQKIRYAGFFTGNATLFATPLLQNRSHDVVFMSQTRGLPAAAAEVQRGALSSALGRLKKLEGELKITNEPEMEWLPHQNYLGFLLDTKVVVSPWGHGEWSPRDIEAIMAGCIVVKPQPGTFAMYPDIYQANKMVIDAGVHFDDLDAAVLSVLHNLTRAQEMVSSAQALLRKFAAPQQYAADLDEFLLNYLTMGLVTMPTLDQ